MWPLQARAGGDREGGQHFFQIIDGLEPLHLGVVIFYPQPHPQRAPGYIGMGALFYLLRRGAL